MKQDNSVHMFNSLLILTLGVIIGAMAIYILVAPHRTPAPNQIPSLLSPLQTGMDERPKSPRPGNNCSAASEADERPNSPWPANKGSFATESEGEAADVEKDNQ